MTPYNQPPKTPNEIVFDSGSSFFHALIDDIDHAETSIYLESYIFNHDAIGLKIVRSLQSAASRGVACKILVDGCGSPHWGVSLAKKLEKSGINTRVFHPFPWQIWNWSRAVIKAPKILRWIFLLLNVNSRNHRKICLIDNRITYVGSINITKEHLSLSEGGHGWRDTAIRITDTNTDSLQKILDDTWTHISIKERLRKAFSDIKQDPIFRLNHTRHRRRILYKQLLRKIDRCQKRIWITNAYFIPDTILLHHLKKIAAQGADVRILLPKKTDLFFPMTWASGMFYLKLLQANIRIFEYQPAMLHAKSIIIDDWVLIGSTNLNHRSLLHDLEIDVQLSTTSAKSIVKQLFLNDIQHAKEIALSDWRNRQPWYKQIIGSMILFAKYWI